MNALRRHRSDVAALGLYLLLTCLLTWPMPFQMVTHLAGRSNDVYINPWSLSEYLATHFREGITYENLHDICLLN